MEISRTSTEVLQRLQQEELSILKQIAALCDKYQLRYYLLAGTLLGAVRHQGFIPWDDDIDIAMPRADFERFQQIAKTELPKELFLHYGTTDPNYYLPFMKIRREGTLFEEYAAPKKLRHQGIFVDIFPLDHAPKNTGFLFHLKGQTIKKLKSILFLKAGGDAPKKGKQWLLAVCLPIPTSWIFRLLVQLMQSHTKEAAPYYANYGSRYAYPKETVAKTLYASGKAATFVSHSFQVPSQAEALLEQIYGANYMELPPEEERRTHLPTRIQFRKEESFGS